MRESWVTCSLNREVWSYAIGGTTAVKGQVLHLLRVQLKVPGDSSDFRVLVTKKSLMFLLRLNEIKFIHNTDKVTGPKRSIKITDRFTCTSANVIYCIKCTLCKMIYIGETGRRIGDRFREHLRDVERNDKDASKPDERFSFI